MFFCDPCKEKNGWPESIFKSYGRCEMCGKHAKCNEIHSAKLPPVKK